MALNRELIQQEKNTDENIEKQIRFNLKNDLDEILDYKKLIRKKIEKIDPVKDAVEPLSVCNDLIKSIDKIALHIKDGKYSIKNNTPGIELEKYNIVLIENAIKYLDEIVEKIPKGFLPSDYFENVLCVKARYAARWGKPFEAIELYQQAEKQDPTCVRAYKQHFYLLASLYNTKKDERYKQSAKDVLYKMRENELDRRFTAVWFELLKTWHQTFGDWLNFTSFRAFSPSFSKRKTPSPTERNSPAISRRQTPSPTQRQTPSPTHSQAYPVYVGQQQVGVAQRPMYTVEIPTHVQQVAAPVYEEQSNYQRVEERVTPPPGFEVKQVQQNRQETRGLFFFNASEEIGLPNTHTLFAGQTIADNERTVFEKIIASYRPASPFNSNR